MVPESPLERYLLFGGVVYYGQGGMYDRLGSYDTLDQAMARSKEPMSHHGEECYDLEWWHIFDTETHTVVAESEKTPHGSNGPLEKGAIQPLKSSTSLGQRAYWKTLGGDRFVGRLKEWDNYTAIMVLEDGTEKAVSV